MRYLGLACLAPLVIALPALAQDTTKRPASWKVRLDGAHGASIPDSLAYETMPPGWHVTTRRYSGIFYDPAWQGSGDFRITATMFLFPDSRAEGYGVFFGGQSLGGDDQRYGYVLLRKDGRYLVKQRSGEETSEVVPWTEHPAIARPTADGNAKNVLVVEAIGDRLSIRVNDQLVTSLARHRVSGRGDGQVGLRLNHGLNVHVSEVRVEPAR